ncbi:hypothetical protein KP509_06G040600 [Ceratopteris richardii]|uniref:glucose-6-phosphate 1-epimerase n=1 Tax=Ceratopteris richardii TaxID=49495 RepID=A0A8T2URZ3_CERRI|nr:hypothetical protein KP509_06G040600 [Ceratopteris richardii]
MPVDLVKDAAGWDILVLRESRGASAVIYLYGGQVTSWKNGQGDELLFMSSRGTHKSSKTMRGGIPICFPQVGNLGPSEIQGLARCRFWTIDSNPPPPPLNGIKTYADLLLKPTDDDLKTWPYNFELRLRVALGISSLTLTTRVRNIDKSKTFSFNFALQTYLSVSDISEVRIEGLETSDYFDNLRNKERRTEQGDALTFDGEIDRVYLSTPTKIAIIDHEKKRTLVLKKEGFPDAGKVKAC